MVKDPRTTWLQPIWDDVLANAGIRTSSLTMLRHPAEVVASRTRSYAKARSGAEARAYAISKIAGWINVSLLNERLTRSNNRPS